MPRFHLHLHECGTVSLDEDGVDCINVAAARFAAITAAREVMCAELAIGKLCMACHIAVTDADGAAVMTVPFREAVTISGL